MFKNKRKKLHFVLLFLIFCVYGYSEILYKISGRVIYNGNGVSNIEIKCNNKKYKFRSSAKTDKDGFFCIYIPNGNYILKVNSNEDSVYISSDIYKNITVNNKNVTNVIFYLEKACKISGKIQFNDNTPIKGAIVHAKNNRSFSRSRSDSDGNYFISGLREADNTFVMAIIPGTKVEIADNLVLNEGTILENIDFIIQKKLSITGIVINKETKEIIKDVMVMVFDGKNNFPAYINENGEFYIYNLLEKKTYSLIVDAPGFVMQLKKVLFAGEQKYFRFEVEKDPEFFQDVLKNNSNEEQ